MKEIKLLRLDVNNFMGIRSLDFSPQGANAELRGDNATFKTSTYSAFLWVLFGKDSYGNATESFSIKTKEHEVIIPGIDHIVSATMDIDGTPMVLSKNYKEKWTKKRGEAQKLLTGHITDYEINGVPIKKKEFDAGVAEIIPEETFRLLTDINYFNSLHWEKRRSILFSLCEGLTENSLNDAEDQKKILASQKKKINEKIEQIQPRIDEKNRDLAVIADYNKAEIQARIADLEKQIQDIKSDSTRATLQKEQADLETKLSQFKADQAKEKQEATAGIRAEIEKTEDGYAKTQHIFRKIEYAILSQDNTIKVAEEDLIRMCSEFDRTIADQNTGVENICYACKQPIPQDQRDAALAAFNLDKSEKLEKINHLGKKTKGQKEEAEKKKVELEDDLKLEQSTIAKIEKELNKKKAELEKILSPPDKPQGDVEIETIGIRLSEIDRRLEQRDQKQDMATLEAELKVEMAKIAELDAGEKAKIRIRELLQEEKNMAATIEELEGRLFGAEQKIQDEAKSVEREINKKFDLVKFQLFETQINQGVKPCCKILVDGNEWNHGLNRGGEINAGLNIIKVLNQHYDIQCPIFIDNCESISYPIDPGCQCFKLIKVKDMKKLEITYK